MFPEQGYFYARGAQYGLLHDMADDFLAQVWGERLKELGKLAKGLKDVILIDRLPLDIAYLNIQGRKSGFDVFSLLGQLVQLLTQEHAVVIRGHGCPLFHDAVRAFLDIIESLLECVTLSF
ncbi:MAG TPA: hypothetical protein PLC32_02830 [Candidatus Omnitrophota bacterium]|nr:hypothetical protein [Candidatus Omnitrophota bacterium]